MILRFARSLAAGAVLALVSACPGPTEPGGDHDPASLTLSHSALSFDALGASQVVTATVLARNGQPLGAEQVEWSSDAPSVAVEVPGGGAGTSRVRASGDRAAVTGASVMLRALANGSATIRARSGDLDATIAVQVAQVPAALSKLGGDGQTGPAGAPLPVPLDVGVQDRLGSPIPNTQVSFQVTAGAGVLSSGSVPTAGDGVARVTWTLGPAAGAVHEVRATVGAGLEVSFGATAVAGPPAQLGVLGGQGQTATAGGPVPVSPSVVVRDPFNNPVAGVAVSFAAAPGSGVVAVPNAVTGADGIATAGGWILGPLAGPNTLTASAGGLTPVAFSATGVPGPAASLAVQAGQGQTALVGTAVPFAPAVLVADQFGNAVPGVAVGFTVTGGGGNVAGGAATTNSSGIAAVDRWTLGTVAGPNTLAAAAAGLPPVQFTATGAAGAPTSLVVQAGDNQSAPAGTAVPVPPAVLLRDTYGNPVPGVGVLFTVTGGGGSLTGAAATTDANGIAAVGSWILGPVPGANSVSAATGGLPPVPFNATGTGGLGPPASIAVYRGYGQAALPGTAVAVAPQVLVRNLSGQPIPGITVTFAVTGGSGSITGASAVSDASGLATVGSWTVGAGANCLTATVAGVPPVSFVATGIPAGGAGYDVHVQYLSCVTPAQEAAFASAAARWSTLITGDVADITFPLGANTCSANPGSDAQSVDDLLIFATVAPIDGVGKILGSAGFCYIRDPGLLPVVGAMFFDSADIANLEASGRLTDVILHEMGHVIGIGTLWDWFGLRQNTSPLGGPPLDTYHSGPNALTGFNNIGGSTYTGGNKVPVENQFGSGTINVHWREAVLANELMTGFLSVGGANPLSELTVRSLVDFGYVVNPAAADPFFLALTLRLEPEHLIALGNDVRVGPIYTVDRTGRITRVRF
ncbi:MAG: leishmanolysin-related zinc metalloendopeptidase [Gemmatimonadales bacterium]